MPDKYAGMELFRQNVKSLEHSQQSGSQCRCDLLSVSMMAKPLSPLAPPVNCADSGIFSCGRILSFVVTYKQS